MRNHLASGILLITGSLLVVVVMMHHPTAHGLMRPESFERVAVLNRLVHGVAIATVPAVFLGLVGVARRIGAPDLSVAALVAFGFGGVAVTIAALASGFVFTDVASRAMSAGAPADAHDLLAYTGIWNRASASVHLVATAAGTLLLGAALLRSRGRLPMAAASGTGGLVVGVLTLLLFFSGHVRLDVHGALLLYTLQSAWTIWLGVAMCQQVKAAPART